MGTDNQIQSRVRAALEAAGEQYEIMPCDPALADTEDFCRHYGIPPENSANTILVKAKTGGERFAACVLLADSKLDVNRCVRKRLGARRVSFASADETRALTGMTLGGVTPLGLPGDMPLWVDSRLMNADYVILGAGVREAKIKVAPSVFRRLPNAEVVEGLAIPRS
ncbi:MAG: YbaK/EbsC family protein [Gammaproteobacteria bacterium]|nr:YbaK/EbsC family protein [Gammaproteobacteria bacterium]